MLYKRNHICYNMYVRWLRESTETKGVKTMTNQNAYMQQLIINDNGVETVYVNICKYHPSSAKIVAWKNKMDKQYKINTTGHFEINSYRGFKWVGIGVTIETRTYDIGTGTGCQPMEYLPLV